MNGQNGLLIPSRVARDEQSEIAEADAHGQRSQDQRDQRDQMLLRGIRENDPSALRAFVKRFRPLLLDQARRLRVSEGDRSTVVTSFLDDILISLARLTPPKALSSYVATSFRRRIAEMHRHEAILERQIDAHVDDLGEERVVSGSCSEFTLRAAGGSTNDEIAPSAAEDAVPCVLLRALLGGCTVEERQLLVWISHRVPLRGCAEWMGISYECARQRVTRLRLRLKRESVAFVASSPRDERAAFIRLLARSGISVDDNNSEEPDA